MVNERVLFIGVFILVFNVLGAFFCKTIIPMALVGYEMVIANEARNIILCLTRLVE